MNFIMIGLLLREALDRLHVRLNVYLVYVIFHAHGDLGRMITEVWKEKQSEIKTVMFHSIV